MGKLICLAERRSVRTSRHGDDYDDERVGDVDDELAIRKTKAALRRMGDRLREFAESESLPASGRLRSREEY